MGWGAIGNGRLLDAAEKAGFALLVVADKNLQYQLNLSKRSIAILKLWTNHRPTLEKYFDSIRAAVDSISPGEYLQLEEPEV
jgi:hypothetical protein